MTTANFGVMPLPATASMALASGARFALYKAGTTTPTAMYSDAALTTSLGSEITESGGRFPQVYLPDGSYKWRVTDADGALIEEKDNVAVGDPTGSPRNVTPEDSGATGDGTTDDTVALVAFFKDLPGKQATSGAGSNYVLTRPNLPLKVTSGNFVLDFKGATLDASGMGQDAASDQVIRIENE